MNLVSPQHQLPPLTRRYIFRLLCQPLRDESVELLQFRVSLAEDNCSKLNEWLYQLYPDEVDLIFVLLRLDNLVFYHEDLNSQVVLYSEHAERLGEIEQEIFRLLGFVEARDD